jgi:molecular chaperone GrpE
MHSLTLFLVCLTLLCVLNSALVRPVVPRRLCIKEISRLDLFSKKEPDGENFSESDVMSHKSIKRLLENLETLNNEIGHTIKTREKDEEDLKKLDEEYGSEIARVKKEFARMKERSFEEARAESDKAKVDALKEILPVTDNYLRARPLFENIESDQEAKILATYDEIFDDVNTVLEEFGVTKISSLGEPFDFNFMEAIMTAPSTEYEKDVVCQEYQVGYKMGEKCIRPAMVVVSTGA